MKKLYEKPEAELVDLLIRNALMNAGMGPSWGIEEDEEEGDS